MLTAGLTTLACSHYDLPAAVRGKVPIKILCIGHGGGSLPLLLANKFRGAIVDIVEIDPVVIKASTQAMGFPELSIQEQNNHFVLQQPDDADQILWKDVSQRLFLYRSNAEDFILNCSHTYDLVFIDAYDGDDIFPRNLWDSDGVFLKNLMSRINQFHGTIVVNLHSDYEEDTAYESLLPMSKYVTQVCMAYKKHMEMVFTISVPWLCNRTLVACSGLGFDMQSGFDEYHVLNTLVSKANLVEFVMDLPFPCVQYIKNGFLLVE